MSYTITKGIKRVDGCEDFELCGTDSIGCAANVSVSFNDNDEILKVKTVNPPKADNQDLREWPQIGDEVILVSMGMAIHNKPVKLTYIGDGVGCYIDLTNSMEYTYAKRETVFKKQKTPEEELHALLNELWHENGGDFDSFADIAVKHVIKKPRQK